MNGWIVIGAKLDKKQLERDLKDAESDLKRYEREAERLATQKVEMELKINFDYSEYEKKVQELANAQQKEIQAETQKKQDPTFRDAGINLIKAKYQEQLNALNDAYNSKLGESEKKLTVINKKIENNKIKQNDVNQEIKEMGADLDKVKTKLSLSDKFGQMKQSAQGIGNSMTGLVKSALKWTLAIFGVRTAYRFLQSAVSTISQYNTQLGADISYIKFALASTLEPVIITIVGWVKTALQYVNYLLHTLFGINIFAGASAKRFQEGAKGLGSANKNAKELKKQLAGFDEMNVLQDNSSSGGGGGGGGGITPPPSVDFSKVIDFSNFHPLEWLKEKLKQIRDWIYSINWQELGSKVYQSIKNFFTSTDWASVFESIYETWGAILGALAGFIIGFLNDAWNDIVAYFQTWIKKSEDMGGGIIGGLLLGILNAIYQIGKWIYDHIFTPFIDGFKKAFGIASPSKVMMEMGTYIIEGLKNGLINIWNAVKSIFENLKNNMINIFKLAWEGIKKVFSTVGSFFGGIVNTIYAKFVNIGSSVGNAIGGTFKSAINSVLSVAERVLNTPITAINKLINKVNELPGVSMSKLSKISLPRLAKGGIINQPGRGVMLGSAIGGERGKEGVIPLTDSQQMALLGEAIGKYITVNASIINTMNGRVISRELHRVQNENDFAYNR